MGGETNIFRAQTLHSRAFLHSDSWQDRPCPGNRDSERFIGETVKVRSKIAQRDVVWVLSHQIVKLSFQEGSSINQDSIGSH